MGTSSRPTIALLWALAAFSSCAGPQRDPAAAADGPQATITLLINT